MPDTDPIIKQRVISVRGPCDKKQMADAMVDLLVDVEGVHSVKQIDITSVDVTYDLLHVSIEQLEKALAEVGFHLENNLLTKLKRALHYYAEENERSNLGLGTLSCSGGCAIKVFAKHYQNRQHGCRDNRPDHFKSYL